jgi:flavin reductase (DIM6/NTAB) family NADH-FMN oxidoreductase RutF
MPIDQRQFREALGGFCTGVTVVTTRADDGELLGITPSSFHAVSLDPPLVLFSLGRKAFSLAKYEAAGGFAVNVLASTQDALCARFAKPLEDKWNGVAYDVWQTGAPILPGCVTNFDCRTYAVHDGGDHVIFIGEVVRMETRTDLEPMIYYRGAFHQLANEGQV